MSLEDWLNHNWLIKHTTSSREIADLLSVIDRDIRAAQVEGLDTDWKLGISYNACLQCAITALAACGYRPSHGSQHHYRAIQSLALTLNVSSDRIATIDSIRRMRNFADYERAGSISESSATEALNLARQLQSDLTAWLKTNHPDLI